MSSPIRIFSTKVLPPAVVKVAQENNIVIDADDFISTESVINDSVANAMMQTGSYLVFTSANAARGWNENIKAAGMHLPHKEIFCLAGGTQTAVNDITNTAIAGTADNANALAKHIIGLQTITAVSFIGGNKHLDELPSLLRLHGIKVTEIEIYTTTLTAKKIDKRYDGFLFFSPSAADSFFSLNNLPATATCFCIGATTAGAVGTYTGNPIKTARETSPSGVLQAVIEYFKKTANN